jgi:tRNA A-37 threonylcarbamoyl transferase component Bud32
MIDARTCPECGAKLPGDLLGGLCPKCVVKIALGSQVRYFGDYEVLEEIGRGGMGVVYKARQASLNRLVALKMLLGGGFASEESLKRFQAEAEAVANLQHPNIVAIHEVGVHEGLHYFSMDYVAGPDLAGLVRDGPLPADQAARYVQRIAEAVHYAHQQGILHRDLKPSNVVIDQFDQPRITDFGLAKRLADDSNLTITGQVLGAPSYMPPEQAAGKRGEVGVPSDVYALGAILYHLLTGRPPFQDETVQDTLAQVVNADPVAPRRLYPSLPRDLETICLKCLRKDPKARYASAEALAADLRRWQAGEPILARPMSRPEWVWRWCRQYPAKAGLSATTGLVLLFGLLHLLWGFPSFHWLGRAVTQEQVASSTTGSLTSRALPLRWSGNGHYYERVDARQITWAAAKAAAEHERFLGATGHLATITSQAENEFIVANLLTSLGSFWLGGYQPEGSAEPDGNWRWITGEPWNYTHWSSGQPDNYRGQEECLVIVGDFVQLGWWNDRSGLADLQTGPTGGFLVEYPVAEGSRELLHVWAGQEAYLTDPQGTSWYKLPSAGVCVDVSPKGERLCYLGPGGVCVGRLDGTASERVVDDAVPWGWLDNDTLLYQPSDQRSVWSVKVATKERQKLFDWSAVTTNGYAGNIALSPDRKQILSNPQNGAWSPTQDLFVCDLRGQNVRVIWEDPNNDICDAHPLWLPGDRFVWCRYAAPGPYAKNSAIVTLRLGETNYRALTDWKGRKYPLAAALDGSKILFVKEGVPKKGLLELWMMYADGTAPRRFLDRPLPVAQGIGARWLTRPVH